MGSLQRSRDGARVLLAPEHMVGRLPMCHLSLDASFISTAHALLRWTGEFWEVRDLNSRNGTYVGEVRLAKGASVRIAQGAEIIFGEASETWKVTDDRPPIPAAVPLDGGEPSAMVSGSIPVPSAEEQLATIFSEGLNWWLEIEETRTPLKPGQVFRVDDRDWRFECPSGVTPTWVAETRPKSLAEVSLLFRVSRNLEHVSLKVRSGQSEQDLGVRVCFYLAYVLCDHRLTESRAGLSDPGWLDLARLHKMVPDYASPSHLNVDICRVRQAIHDAAVEDSIRIIERRRGQLRFGTDAAEIVRESGPMGTSP